MSHTQWRGSIQPFIECLRVVVDEVTPTEPSTEPTAPVLQSTGVASLRLDDLCPHFRL